MEGKATSEQIARILSEIWVFHQSPSFADYAKHAFGYQISKIVKCDAIYIAEAEDGDAALGSIGGLVKHWWLVDDCGMTRTPVAKLPLFRGAPENLRSRFYLVPVVKFLYQQEAIAIGEAFGPEMHCRKVGKVFVADGVPSISGLRVVWNNNMI